MREINTDEFSLKISEDQALKNMIRYCHIKHTVLYIVTVRYGTVHDKLYDILAQPGQYGNKEEWEKWGTLPFPYTVAVQQHVLQVLHGLPPVRLGSGNLQNLLDVSPKQLSAS